MAASEGDDNAEKISEAIMEKKATGRTGPGKNTSICCMAESQGGRCARGWAGGWADQLTAWGPGGLGPSIGTMAKLGTEWLLSHSLIIVMVLSGWIAFGSSLHHVEHGEFLDIVLDIGQIQSQCFHINLTRQ